MIEITRVLILQGHPDSTNAHFCHALADAYAEGASSRGCEVRHLDVASVDFPWLKSQQEFETETPAPAIRAAQEAILWAQHLVIIHPLWLGSMPAILKAFFEQVLRPGFSHRIGGKGLPQKLLAGRSARIVITMGMPAFFYRWYFGAHGLQSLRRSVLAFCGFAPIRDTLIGSVQSASPVARTRWLERMRGYGREGS